MVVKSLTPKLGASSNNHKALQLWPSSRSQKRFYSSKDAKKITDPQIKASLDRAFAVLFRDPNEALKIFNEIHGAIGNDESVLIGQARALFSLERGREALEVLDIISSIYPNAPISALKGKIQLKQGNVKQAITTLQYAAERSPKDIDILNDLGKAYLSVLKLDEAIDTFQKANEIEPNNCETMLGLTGTYLRYEPFFITHALAIAEKATELHPKIPSTWHSLAKCYEATGDLVAALACYEKTSSLMPGHVMPASALEKALLLMRMSKLVEAEKQLKILLLLPDDETQQNAGIQLVMLYTVLKTFNEAKELARRLTKIFPTFATAWYHLGKTTVTTNLDEAIQYLEKALSLSNNSSEVQCSLATCYFLKGQHEQALQHFQKAEIFNLSVLRVNEMFNEGKALIELLLKHFPQRASAIYNEQMELAGRKRDYVEEYQAYLKMLETSNKPEEQVEWLLLNNYFAAALKKAEEILVTTGSVVPKATVLVECGRVKEALDLFQTHKPDKMDVPYAEMLATALSRDNDSLDEGEKVCKHLASNYAAQMALSEIYYRRGNYKEAMEIWAKAQRINDSLDPFPMTFPLRHLAIQQHAKILEALGLIEEAIQDYIHVLEINPLNLVSKQRLTALQAKVKKNK